MTEPSTTSPPPSTTVAPPHATLIDLHNISSALSAFQNSINDLQLHLHTLKFSIDTLIANNPSTSSQIPITPPSNPISLQDPTTLLDIIAPTYGTVKKVARKWEETILTVDGVVKSRDDSFEELKNLCETMNHRGLKRYVVNHLNDIGNLRLEVPKALKYAPNAAKLVLNCCGRFFVQIKRGYEKDLPLVTGREASVLILECFMLMEGMGNESRIEDDVKDEADGAVTSWRKRMISEGGIMRACEIDARGLLLLLGCYGVPPTFRSADLGDLFRASNAREMAGTLRRSSSLVERVPEMIELMVQSKQEVDAIDVAYTFGFEEQFNVQTILTSFLQQIKEPLEKVQKPSASLAAVIDADREQLAVLKSFAKCLKGHKIDSSKIISGQEIQEKISRLEKDIFEYDKKIISEYDEKIRAEKIKKRIADEAEIEAGRRSRFLEGKLSCYTVQLLSEYDEKIRADKIKKRTAEEAEAEEEAGRRSRFREEKLSCYIGQLLQPQRVGHNGQKNLFDAGMASHINGYSASQSMLHAHVPGTGYAAVGTYGGLEVDSSGHAINHGVQSYGWHADPTLTERVVTHSYAAQPSSTLTEYDEKIRAEKIEKRKAEEAEAEAEAGRRSRFWEGKLSRYTGQRLEPQKVGQNSQRSLFDTGMGSHINCFAASQSMLHAQVSGTSYAAVGAYGEMDVDPSGHVINHGVQSYGWHADPTFTERAVTHSYAARPSASSFSTLYRPASSSLEDHVMLPSGSSIAIPNLSATPDLYNFIDGVVDDEYRPTVVPSCHMSYRY